MQWLLSFSRVNHWQSSTSPHFSMQPSRVAMAKESTKSPLHLKAPWHSLAGHLLKHTTTVIGYFCSQCNMGNMANQILTPSLHWCSQGRAQQRVGQRHPCSWQRACTAQRLAPMTTNCTHHSCHKTCDTLQHLESLWSRWNIPMRVSRVRCKKPVGHKSW